MNLLRRAMRTLFLASERVTLISVIVKANQAEGAWHNHAKCCACRVGTFLVESPLRLLTYAVNDDPSAFVYIASALTSSSWLRFKLPDCWCAEQRWVRVLSDRVAV